MIGLIWSSVMSSVEWNKKEELVTEQAIKLLKVTLLIYGSAVPPLCGSHDNMLGKERSKVTSSDVTVKLCLKDVSKSRLL